MVLQELMKTYLFSNLKLKKVHIHPFMVVGEAVEGGKRRWGGRYIRILWFMTRVSFEAAT